MAFTWRNVPGYFDFDDIYSEAVARARDGARFVEVGVLLGKSTLYMAEAIRASGKQIAFDAVDLFDWDTSWLLSTFKANPAYLPTESMPVELRAHIDTGAAADDVVRFALQLAGLDGFANVIKATGQARCASYEDASLDFVFVDASHTYEDTAELLRTYLTKVKHSGVLAGHDYTLEYPGVAKAVAEVLGQVEQRRSSFVWRKTG